MIFSLRLSSMALVANFSVVPPLFSSVKNFEFFMANVLTCHNDIPNDLVLITCQHLVVESINSYLSPAVWLEPFQNLNSMFSCLEREARKKELFSLEMVLGCLFE